MRYRGDQMFMLYFPYTLVIKCVVHSLHIFQAALEAQVKVEQQSTAGLAGILATIEQGQGERGKFTW